MKKDNVREKLYQYGVQVCSVYDKHNGVVVFGAGVIGARICGILKSFNMFAGYIDNNIEKQNLGFKNEKVYSVDEIINKNCFIVLAGTDEHMPEMMKQLFRYGLQINNDFILYNEFETSWFQTLLLYKFDRLYTNLAQICVTERCTLKCKKCAHACHLVPMSQKDMMLESVKKSADCFFEVFDVVNEFVLIGGEPFLYKNLGILIDYICKKYREKINLFTITTNGTLVPNEEVLKSCKKNSVVIRVSDYSKTIPRLLHNYKKLYKTLDEYGIDYLTWETDDKNSWVDYGFDVLENKSIEDTMATYRKCKTLCREVKEDRYYYCVMAHTVAENMGLDFGKDDYLDLNQNLTKEEILLFELGYNEKGYLDMCSICRGKDAEKYTIPAAEQVSNTIGRK